MDVEAGLGAGPSVPSGSKVAPSAGHTSSQPLLGGGSVAPVSVDDSESPELTVQDRLSQANANNGFQDEGKGKGQKLTAANLCPTGQSFVGREVEVPGGSSVSDARLAGLTSAEASSRLFHWGRNEIPEKIVPWYVMLGMQFVGMMPFMLFVAAAVSAVIGDWVDLAVIGSMLILNALIGFHEEHKAQQSLDALKAQMTATVPVKRDGHMQIRPVAELVPGDVVFLRGGNVVPADCEWLEGDEMLVDTAALTGEPIPRKVPRPDRDHEPTGAGRLLLSGCIIKQGEGHCEVLKTGLNTEIGQAAGLVQEASGHTAGIFETKIMQVVRLVILISIVDAAVALYVNCYHRGGNFKEALLGVLALVIGAVPIALPLVMQVTLAIGAATMAGKKAIVTHLTALQEVASMTVLCSDKTGTLTTAQMRVDPSSTWTRRGITRDDALLFAALASNPANKEDPIDKAVLQSCYEHFGSEDQAEVILSEFRKTRFVGFNPIVKRTVVYCEHPTRGTLKISKGLVDKVLITGDDGGDCWECADAAALRAEIQEVDQRFSERGFKTVGIAISEGGGPMQFVAIVPMIDPPRSDTKETIYRIRLGGVAVKMVTGDHLNIAITTSRKIGLGTGILPANDLWPASATRDEMIMSADGFAQVLPKDKREVVLVLQARGLVVGMTGDGVNDAPALAQAQIGIAVDGATEAARSAADIILTTPGLSAIFDAVMESRKIFSRLRSYVIYRLAATIQIVLVLSILIFAYDAPLKPVYVILLALLNDISLLPIADDNAQPSALPEIPSMQAILLAATLYGILGTAQTMVLYKSGWLGRNYDGDHPKEYLGAAIYIQISIAVELLIFSCRTPGFVLANLGKGARPSLLLTAAVLAANVLVSVLAGLGEKLNNQLIFQVDWADIALIWGYNIAGLLLIDGLKAVLVLTGQGWMSAGAVGGVLEYADLPEEEQTDQRTSLVHPHHASLHRSSAMHHGSIRSMLFTSRGPTANSLVLGSSQVGWTGVPHAPQYRSGSTLPYPYNLRAAALRNLHSF